jgi:cytochrome oxidase Cu insertion factor (SCO1/SenC/PrrC family)
VDHSIVLYLVNREGEFVDFFTQRTQVGDVVDRIEKHIKDYDAKVLATSATKQ